MSKATLEFKPIRFDRRGVALMIRVANFLDPKFAQKVGEPARAIELYADLVEEGCGVSPAVLKYFNLQRDKRSFVWNPR